MDLADTCSSTWERDNRKRLAGWVKSHQGVRAKIAEPHNISIVHIHRIRLRAVPWQPPLLPFVTGGMVSCDVARKPLADPDLPL